MKKLFFTALPVCILVFVSCKNNGSTTTSDTSNPTVTKVNDDAKPGSSTPTVFETATAYNDYIIKRQRDIYDYIFKMNDAAKTDAEAAGKIIDAAVPEIERMLEEIKNMPSFKGDIKFRDDAVALFGFYKTTFDKSYRKILSITKKGSKMTKAESAQVQQISNDITQTEAGLDAAMKASQNAFATTNNMQVQEAKELQEKVDNMNKKDN